MQQNFILRRQFTNKKKENNKKDDNEKENSEEGRAIAKFPKSNIAINSYNAPSQFFPSPLKPNGHGPQLTVSLFL